MYILSFMRGHIMCCPHQGLLNSWMSLSRYCFFNIGLSLKKVQYVLPIHRDIGDHYPWMKKEYLIKSYLIISNLITTNLNSLVLILSISFNVTFSASLLVSLIRWRFSLKPGRYYPNMSDSDWSRKVPGWDAGWKFPNCFLFFQ